MLASGQDSATILKLANMEQMVANVEVSEADVVRVTPGQKVRLTLLGDPGSAIDATVRMIEPAPTSLAESDSTQNGSEAVYYNAVLDVANPEGKLRIGMTVEATIVLDRHEDVLTLVSSAIGKSKDGRVVTVWNPMTHKGEDRVVEVGLTNAVMAEIISGLTENDQVVAEHTNGGSSAAVSIRGPRGVGF